ncbi:MAG: PAS domain S-box protein [Pseudomonadota bacterium]
MTEKNKTNDQLLLEAAGLRRRITGLEALINMQKQAQEALKQCEAYYQEIVQSVNSIILLIDTEGNVLFLNKFGLVFFGFAEHEIVGKNAVGTIVPETDTAGHNLAAMIKDMGQHPEHYIKNENENIRRSGERVWVSWTNRAVYDQAGRIKEIICVGNDLTEHKLAEEALQKQSYMMCVRLKELNCLYDISKAIGRQEASLEEVLQETVTAVPSGFEFSEIAFAKIILEAREFRTGNCTDTAWTIESPVYVNETLAGSVKVYYLNERPLRDEGPFRQEERNLINAIAATVGRFVTRKRAQEALLASEIKYKTLFENIPQKICYKDKNLIYISCNSNYARDLKMCAEAIAGKTDYDVYPHNLAEHYRSEDKEVLDSGVKLSRESAYIQDGKEIVTHKIKTPVKDEKGAVIGIISIFIDVTELRKYEREKVRIEAAIQSNLTELSIKNEITEILLSTNDLTAILHMILVGATAYQALGFNRAFLFLLDDTQKILEGKIATGALSSDEAYKTWARLAQERQTLTELLTLTHGEFSKEDAPINNLVRQMTIPLTEQESIFFRGVVQQRSFNIVSGSHLSFRDKKFAEQLGTDSFALVPLVCRDKTLGVLLADNFINKKPICDSDVASLQAFANHASLAIENSRLYESLEEKIDELSQANKELSENRDKLIKYERLSVVGEMAAKIAHDIRNPMTAIGGFARRILTKELGEDITHHYMQIIVQEVDRLEKILNDLLGFTKPPVARFKIADLNSIIQSAYEILALELEQHTITVVEKYDPALPQMLLDPDQIRRVLINIFKNAVEAMPEGGTITVITSHENHRWATVEIADTGTGIPAAAMDKIFEPFYTNKATGSGLGLTLAVQIINSHGGTLDVYRGKTAGTVVAIHLPVQGLGKSLAN